ncbi:MAG: isocitrate lyase/PEP mutase family protein [Blastocatellia bacterium]
MQRTTQQERAEAFHRLHAGDKPLVLVNAWDAASARLFEQAGAPAIATTSAGIAWSLGYSDGEQMDTRELIQACARICRVVTAPVSVDIERGFGRTPTEVCETVRALLELGVVGINIEDGVAPGAKELVQPSVLAEKISAIRAVAEEVGVRLFINARTDTYFVSTVEGDDPVARYDETAQRARIYVEAGADGIFVPGLESLEEMERMARETPQPLNIYAGYAGLPPVAALGRAGVRRVSLGCGPFQAALALARRVATEALNEGTYTTMTASMLSAGEMNNLFTVSEK